MFEETKTALGTQDLVFAGFKELKLLGNVGHCGQQKLSSSAMHLLGNHRRFVNTEPGPFRQS